MCIAVQETLTVLKISKILSTAASAVRCAYYVVRPSANDHWNAFLCSLLQLLSVKVPLTRSWSWTCRLFCGLRSAASLRWLSCDPLADPTILSCGSAKASARRGFLWGNKQLLRVDLSVITVSRSVDRTEGFAHKNSYRVMLHQSAVYQWTNTGVPQGQTWALTSTSSRQDFHKSALMFPIINIFQHHVAQCSIRHQECRSSCPLPPPCSPLPVSISPANAALLH